jgi:hypothetical protein
MGQFDYGSTEAWETSTDVMLTVGNHVVTIVDPVPGESSAHNPEIQLKVENDKGSMRDWIQITDKTVGKVVQLFDAAKEPPPGEGEFNPDTGALTQACLDRLNGKKVGVVIREEANQDPSKPPRSRIKGYVEASRVNEKQSDVPSDGVAVAAGSSRTDDIPF